MLDYLHKLVTWKTWKTWLFLGGVFCFVWLDINTWITLSFVEASAGDYRMLASVAENDSHLMSKLPAATMNGWVSKAEFLVLMYAWNSRVDSNIQDVSGKVDSREEARAALNTKISHYFKERDRASKN